MLGKEELFLFTYISENNKLFRLVDDGIVECNFEEFSEILRGKMAKEVDLDEIFTPKNILASSLNSTELYLTGQYLLTEHQENKKKSQNYL